MKTPNPKFQAPDKHQTASFKQKCWLLAGISFVFGDWCLFVFCFLVFAFSSLHAADTDDPTTELASFQIADGFEVNLFASEKDGVVKPIQIRFDARGRLWVIGSTVYPQLEPGQVPNDKVLILEDTDGDGRCDRTTV